VAALGSDGSNVPDRRAPQYGGDVQESPRSLRHSDWWQGLIDEVRQEINDQILSQNLQIATEAGKRVLDSLENGDEKLVWDKSKDAHVIKRVKISGKDAAVIGGISQDKARLQLNLPTSITAKSSDITALAEQFRKLSSTYEERRINSIPGESEEVTD
jgi:hypothetical protein